MFFFFFFPGGGGGGGGGVVRRKIYFETLMWLQVWNQKRLRHQKQRAHDIVFTQWFRDGKANRDSQNRYYKNAKCDSCEGQVM